MIAKMKCSNCGAEMSNLNLSWGRKQLWFIVPVMALAFLPLLRIYWLKGVATKDLVVSEVKTRAVGSSLEVTGVITNEGRGTFSGVTIEAEFFDAAGNFVDEESASLRTDIPKGAKEYFKVSLGSVPPEASEPDTKMVVKVSGGFSSVF